MTNNLTVQRSDLKPDDVWGYFYEIEDVTNLNPSEERFEAWEVMQGGDRVGMCVVDELGRPFLSRIVTHPNHRREGVAKALLRALMDEYDEIHCRVRKDNGASIALLASVDWERTGECRFDDMWRYKFLQ